MDKERLTERIKKLLALATSSNENEAQAAMLKAQKLMMEHGLEMKDVEDIDFDEKEISKTYTDDTMSASWKVKLMRVIAENFKCEYYFSGRRGSNKGVFLGLKQDAEVAKMVFEYAIKKANAGADKCYDSYWLKGLPAKGVRGDYKIGFVDGLESKFAEQRKANPGWALVLVKDVAVTEEYSKMTFTGSMQARATQTAGNSAARQIGFNDGKNFGYEKQISR
jgi:hypothetical protein